MKCANTRPQEHLTRWVEQTKTANGVYGLKVFGEQFGLLRRSRWAERLPNLTFVHIERLDVLAQAISLVRALQTSVFDSNQAPKREPVYNRGRIASTLEQILFNQARWSCWFARNGIAPLRLTYEGIAADPAGAVSKVAERLGIEVPPPVEPEMQVQRDQLSDVWRRRFLAESRDLGYFDYPSEPARQRIARLKALLLS